MIGRLEEAVINLQMEAKNICDEYLRARQAFALASAQREQVLARLRQAVLDGANELSRDGLEAVIRTMAAIHKGEEDLAYAYARASVRALVAAREGLDDLYANSHSVAVVTQEGEEPCP